MQDDDLEYIVANMLYDKTNMILLEGNTLGYVAVLICIYKQSVLVWKNIRTMNIQITDLANEIVAPYKT